MIAPTATPTQLTALRERVSTVLLGGSCARIAFQMAGQLGGVQVRPGGYAVIGMAVAVAPPVQSGFGRQRQIGVAIQRQGTGVAAHYQTRSNTLSFPNHSYGRTPVERACIVHECTHAIYDYGRFRVTWLEAEAGAFIAEALFNRLEHQDQSQVRTPHRRIAWEISADLLQRGAGTPVVDATQQRLLIHEIASRPVYAHRLHGMSHSNVHAYLDGGRI